MLSPTKDGIYEGEIVKIPGIGDPHILWKVTRYEEFMEPYFHLPVKNYYVKGRSSKYDYTFEQIAAFSEFIRIPEEDQEAAQLIWDFQNEQV